MRISNTFRIIAPSVAAGILFLVLSCGPLERVGTEVTEEPYANAVLSDSEVLLLFNEACAEGNSLSGRIARGKLGENASVLLCRRILGMRGEIVADNRTISVELLNLVSRIHEMQGIMEVSVPVSIGRLIESESPGSKEFISAWREWLVRIESEPLVAERKTSHRNGRSEDVIR
jgi:hypothetical protein